MSKHYSHTVDINLDGDTLRDWVNDEYDPDDVFPNWKLEEWATRMGWVPENEKSDLEDTIKELNAKIEELEDIINRMER